MPDAGQAATPAAEANTPTQPVASAPPPQQQEQPTAEPVAPAPKPAPPKPAAGAPKVAEPEPGAAYLQVLATARTEAEAVGETLSRRGFKTQLSPAPTAGTFRVLVGPLKDAAEIARTRADLEKAGFKPIVRRF
jgi:cell division septation protein DedD